MSDEYRLLIDESIQLEQHAAELYEVFHIAFPDDAHFWWQLHIEEQNHAALIESGNEHFLPLGKFPCDLVSHSLKELQHANSKLVAIIQECRETSPSREAAFNIAIDVEGSAGEIHLQRFMEKDAEYKIDEVFQQLNKGDKDHALRILSYMNEEGVRVREKTAGVSGKK